MGACWHRREAKKILKYLTIQIEKVLKGEGFVIEKDSLGLSVPGLKIIYWTDDTSKFDAINEIVNELRKEGIINVKVD